MAEAADRVGVVADFIIDKFKSNAAEYNRILRQVDSVTMEVAQRMQASGAKYEYIEAVVGRTAAAHLQYAVDVDRATQALGEHAAAQEQAAGAQEEVADSVDDTTDEIKGQTKAMSFNIKKMVLWTIGAASVFRLYMKLRRAITKVIREVYGHTKEMKRLTTSWDDFTHAVVASLVPYDEVLGLMDQMAGAINKVSSGLLGTSAELDGYTAAASAAARESGYLGGTLQGILTSFEAFATLGPIPQQFLGWLAVAAARAGILSDETAELTLNSYDLAKAQRESANALAMAGEEAKKDAQAMREYLQVLDRVVDMGFRAGEGLAQYMEQMGEAFQRYQQDQADAWQDYYDEIEDINADAIAAREKAWKSYYNQIEKLRLAVHRRETSDAARHALRMEHARRRHALTLLQNERIYQYSRRQLVGEGDVLAIEDLDARYELERQAQEENFQLQMWQMEQMAQLQRRINQEAMRDQIVALRAALNEQLQEIEENRRDKLTEAEESRDEQLFVAEQTYNQSVAAAKKGYDEWQRAEAEHWAKLALQAGLGLDEITTLVRGAYGVGSPMEQHVSDWFARIRAMYIAFAAQLAPLLLPSFRPMLPSGRMRGYQHGGEFVATQPTTIMVGEGNAPERVSVQPMSSIGGALSVGWSGGAIPVHGTGSMDGADLGQIGETIGAGLMVALRDTVLSYRGVRGS